MPDPAFASADAALAAFRAKFKREPVDQFELEFFQVNGWIPAIPIPRPAPAPIPVRRGFPHWDELFPTPLKKKPDGAP